MALQPCRDLVTGDDVDTVDLAAACRHVLLASAPHDHDGMYVQWSLE